MPIIACQKLPTRAYLRTPEMSDLYHPTEGVIVETVRGCGVVENTYISRAIFVEKLAIY